jgi:hypothetical protein
VSLLREIQKDIATPGCDLPSILLNCKILAARLGSDEFVQWLEWELNGYPESQPIPYYRRLSTQYFASFSDAAGNYTEPPVPFDFFPEKYRESYLHTEFHDGIAKVWSFARSNNGAVIHRPELIPLLQGKLNPGMRCQRAWCLIAATEFRQVISSVKSSLLDFVLEIEAANPDAGEAPLNSNPVPQEKLPSLVNVFHGPVGNVAQLSQDVRQTTTMGVQPEDLSRLIAELTSHLDELPLDSHQKRQVESHVATLSAQLLGTPNPLIVNEAGRTLRNILEGATGSLIASAAQPSVWQWVHGILSQFN